MTSISFAIQGAPGGRPDAATLVVVALLAAAVFLIWWASRPATIARYAAREPGLDPASPAAPPLERGEGTDAGH